MNKKKLLLCVILGFILILAAIITIMAIGSKTRKEEDQPMFQRVKLALEDEDPQVGLAELKYYLGKRPDSAEAHLLLANLYDERLGMPLEAIFEYRAYLELAGESANREEVNLWITAAKKRCFLEWTKEFSGLFQDSRAEEIISLRNEVRELRYQLQQAKESKPPTIATASADTSSKPVTADAESEQPSAPQTTAAAKPEQSAEPQTAAAAKPEQSAEPQPQEAIAIYTVAKGDNLAKISQKFYNTSANANLIYEHNKDVLKSPNLLPIGRKLKIPPAPKSAAAPAPETSKPRELPPIKPLSEEQLRKLRGENSPPVPQEKPAPQHSVNNSITPYLYN